MIKVATAFSGGLAACEFALKYEELEHEVVFACEWDKYARKQYLKFHGEPKTFYNDVSDLDAKKYLNQIDLYVWGSPCQDLSLAGQRKGFDGAKSSLFREGARVMNEMKPRSFIFENVKGLLSSNGGADYKEVIKTFKEMGYLIAMKVVNTKEHGIPQNRERVFIVGFLDPDEYHAFNFAEPEPLKLLLRDMLEEEVDEKYYLSDKMIDGFMKHKERHEDRGNGFAFAPKSGDDIAGCLSVKAGNRQTDNYIKEPQLIQVGNIDTKGHNSLWGRVYNPNGLGACLNANGGGAGAKTGLYHVKSATTKGYEVATVDDSINFTHPDSKTRRGRVGKGVAQTLDCACNQGIIEPKIGAIRGRNPSNPKSRTVGESTEQMLEINDNGTSNCLTTVQKDNVVVEEFRIRRLTPKECFRLQGLRCEDIQLVNSDTQSYKIAGNAISVNVMQMISRQIYKAEKPKDTLF